MKTHRCHAPEDLPALKDRLRRESRKVTGPREAILAAMRGSSGPVTIKEILRRLPPPACNLVTIYRSMRLLERAGIVKRFDFGDGVSRFELLGEGDDGHHHHLVCVRCAGVVEVDECFPRNLEEKIARKNGFVSVTHKLEFFGVCPKCR